MPVICVLKAVDRPLLALFAKALELMVLLVTAKLLDVASPVSKETSSKDVTEAVEPAVAAMVLLVSIRVTCELPTDAVSEGAEVPDKEVRLLAVLAEAAAVRALPVRVPLNAETGIMEAPAEEDSCTLLDVRMASTLVLSLTCWFRFETPTLDLSEDGVVADEVRPMVTPL